MNESTVACNEYNTRNAEAISVGVIDAWEPSDRIVEQEKEKARVNSLAAVKLESLNRALAMIDPRLKAQPPNNSWNNYGGITGIKGVKLDVETSGHSYNSTGKICFSGDHCETKNWMKVKGWQADGSFPFTGEDAARAKDKLAKVEADEKLAVERYEAKVKVSNFRMEKFQSFIATTEGLQLLKDIGDTGYISDYEYDTYAFGRDGRLTYKYETYTTAQWRQIVDLRDAHLAAMKALKDSFKTVA